MAIPYGYYKFEVYNGDTFLGKLTYPAQLRRNTSSERYQRTGSGQRMDLVMMNIWGFFPQFLYHDKKFPPAGYLQESTLDVTFTPVAGFNVEGITDHLMFYTDKANNVGIEWWQSGNTYYYRYFNGTWQSNNFSVYSYREDYDYWSGMMLGRADLAGIPLPDFEYIATHADTDNAVLCFASIVSTSRYYLGSGTTLPTAESYELIVNIGSETPGNSLKVGDLKNWLLHSQPKIPDDDNPYWDAGISEPGGGDPANQNFDESSDSVEEDAMPSISAVGTGMATLFTPTASQLKNLADIMWGSQWWQALQNTVEGIDKMFVSLGIVPFTVASGQTVEVTWLGLSITEVILTLAAQQYYEFNMGSIDLSDDSRIYTSDTALDYSPFSKLGIYLPFIGYQELDIDEFRGHTVNLVYRIDILSGTCVALIKINGNTIYQFTGNCMTQIPITSQSFENMITNAVNVGIAVSGVRSAQAVGSAANGVAEELSNKGKASEKQKALSETKSRVHVEGAIDRLLSAGANSIMGLKPNYDKSGAVSNSASLLAVKQPFLFLTTPRMCVPEHYQRYSGFPSNITARIGDCSGFLVVESIRLNGLVATSSEVEEIYDLLKSGVIV